MNLLACGDAREEVREDGKKGIRPPEDAPAAVPPQFEAMLVYIHGRVSALRTEHEQASPLHLAYSLVSPPFLLL